MIFETNIDIPAMVQEVGQPYFSIRNAEMAAYMIDDHRSILITDSRCDQLIEITAENAREARKIAEALVRLLNAKYVKIEVD